MPKVKAIATRQLNISTHRCALRPQQAQHQVGTHMAVGAHQLAGDDHHRPDGDIDDDLLGPGDRIGRIDIAAEHLQHGDHQREGAEQTNDGPLDPVPDGEKRAMAGARPAT